MPDEIENAETIAEEISEEIAAVAAEIVEDANERAEHAEIIAEAVIEAHMESVDEQRRQEFETRVTSHVNALEERLSECHSTISLLELKLMTLETAQAEMLSSLAISKPRESAEGQPEAVVIETPPEAVEVLPENAEENREVQQATQRQKRRVRLL